LSPRVSRSKISPGPISRLSSPVRTPTAWPPPGGSSCQPVDERQPGQQVGPVHIRCRQAARQHDSAQWGHGYVCI
jgi:hypothetical protein